MNTTLNINLSIPGTPRPADESTGPVGKLRALLTLSERELVELAERYDIAGDRFGLDAVRDEAERRAHHQGPESLAAQVAGYLGLLAEDTELALADEARTWNLELHRAPAAEPSVSAARPHADRSVRS